MTYSVKEIFYSLQGEGAHTGRPGVFCRFAGCNLWSGREQDRAGAICPFCDTDFVGTDGPGGGTFADADALAEAIAARWPAGASRLARPYVVCTGGEPLLQLDQAAVDALHRRGFEVAIETNGTLMPPADIDWICVSPKARAEFVLLRGHELKLVFPQPDLPPARFEPIDPGRAAGPAGPPFEGLHFPYYFLQPMAGPDLARNTRLALAYCLAHPQWRLSVQTHKLLGIP